LYGGSDGDINIYASPSNNAAHGQFRPPESN
jgi:hypothetical protein